MGRSCTFFFKNIFLHYCGMDVLTLCDYVLTRSDEIYYRIRFVLLAFRSQSDLFNHDQIRLVAQSFYLEILCSKSDCATEYVRLAQTKLA